MDRKETVNNFQICVDSNPIKKTKQKCDVFVNYFASVSNDIAKKFPAGSIYNFIKDHSFYSLSSQEKF